MTKKVLIVDDEPAQVRLATQVLTASGYRVVTAASGPEAVRQVYEGKPDLVLLDVMMPEIDGWQTCRMIREASDIPVIMMTGKRNSEDDIVRGLECGADEYISKPVGNRELMARVKASLRRADKPVLKKDKPKTVFHDEYLTIDIAERKIIVNGKKLKLTPREFHLLTLLLENAGHVMTHQQVLEHVWGWEYIDDVDYVRIYISHLRQKLEPEPSSPRYILTEPGVGYYFRGLS